MISTAPRWVPPATEAGAAADALVSSLGIPRPLARVLAGRGLVEPVAARAFLRPSLGGLHDPLLLPDIEPAIDRILAAIGADETIFVHGDFDADGMTAAALAVRGLRRLGASVFAFVPHRVDDGYDLTPATVRRAAATGASLIVTVDCGVTAVEAVDTAAALGIDVVITDHHRPGPMLPAAIAVVDPVRADSVYPWRGLSGVGVAFKLLAALFARRGVPEPELFQHLDLVAIGTVADQMPLLDENRALVRAGLRALARTRKPGLRALMAGAKIDASAGVATDDIAFRLAPRLNSVGRMAAAATGLELLLCDESEAADALAVQLDEQNAARRMADREVTEHVEEALRKGPSEPGSAVIVWGDGWHPGVVGIVASRVVDRWRRPAIVVSFDGDLGVGSARSVDGFHLFRALEECGEFLERFGGHKMAAGLSIRRERIEAFADRMRALARERLPAERPGPVLRLDLELPLRDVTLGLWDELRHLAPHGNGNPAPLLAVRGVRIEAASAVGPEGRHLRARLADGEARLPAIGFGHGHRLDELAGGAPCDAAFHLERDQWKGRVRLQARLVDVRSSGV
ncbi:MAG: single-stranded-DNA-specific exonuclease RecJ [Gemmatimonadota bacterium]